jgi:hypothetical protein
MKTEIDILKLAFSELRTPDTCAAFGLRDVIFFLVQPPYGLPWSAEIFLDVETPDVYSVMVAIWDRLSDFPDHEVLFESGHAAGSPEYLALKQSMLADSPTIQRSMHKVPRELIDTFVEGFSRHAFSFVPTALPSFEVEHIEFRVGNTSTFVAISWWGEGPSQWSLAIKEIREFIAKISGRIWPRDSVRGETPILTES